MKNMNRKQKIIVSITGIFLVLLILVGLTYGYFLTRIQGNTNSKSISVTTADLKLTYTDGNGIVAPTDKLLPGTTLNSKTFTVKNDGDTKTEYGVIFDKVYNELSRQQDLVYTVTCTSDKGTCNGVSNETIFPNGGGTKENGTGFGIVVTNSIEVGATHSYVLTVKYLEPNVDQSIDMGKTIQARVTIADMRSLNPYANDTKTLAGNIVNGAINVTNEQEKKGYAKFRTVAVTTVGKDASTVYDSEEQVVGTVYFTDASDWVGAVAKKYNFDKRSALFTLQNLENHPDGNNVFHGEIYADVGDYFMTRNANSSSGRYLYKVLSRSGLRPVRLGAQAIQVNIKSTTKETSLLQTTDDDGISYYYRGNVKNNYVNFAGMCWRIVRIAGDGSIKLILEDQNTTCNNSAYNGNWNLGNSIYGYTAKNLFSMHGANDYAKTYRGDYDNSSVNGLKSKITTWYNSKIKSNESKLKSESICLGDVTTKYDLKNRTFSLSYGSNGGSSSYSASYYNYDTYKRLKDGNASLICNGKKSSPSYVYTITADEVAFAGGKDNVSNQEYYLLNNYQRNNKLSFWTASLSLYNDYATYTYGYEGYGDNAYRVSSYGALSTYKDDTNISSVARTYGVRPMITLKKGTVLSSGDGSKKTPYVVS